MPTKSLGFLQAYSEITSGLPNNTLLDVDISGVPNNTIRRILLASLIVRINNAGAVFASGDVMQIVACPPGTSDISSKENGGGFFDLNARPIVLATLAISSQSFDPFSAWPMGGAPNLLIAQCNYTAGKLAIPFGWFIRGAISLTGEVGSLTFADGTLAVMYEDETC